ncbi:MAG TPA: VC0807 family protein [Actinomycetes bacterium]
MTTQAAPPAPTSRLRALLPTLLDLVIPTAGYFLLHWAGLPDVWALTIAGSATGVNALINTIRRGRLDVLGLLVVAEIAVSVVLVVVTADPRLILVRPAVYLAVAGVVNLVSCFAGRPLTYTASTPMATKGDPERAVAYELAWHHSPELRRIHRQLTAAIGVALVAYAVIRVLIVYSFPTGTAVLAQEVPGILLIALVVVLIRRRVPRLRRIVDAEQAALAAEPITTNAGTAGAEHNRHRGDDDPGPASTDQVRNSRA